MKSLLARDLQRADHALSNYVAHIPAGTPASTLLVPEYWAHNAPRLRVNDTITCLALDNSFEIEMRLIQKAPGKLVFRVLRDWRAESDAEAAAPQCDDNDDLEINFVKAQRWRIVNKRTDEVLAAGIETKDAAEAELGRLRG